MAITKAPIDELDVVHFADELSDFGFELKVFQALKNFNLADLSHGEYYIDPFESIYREYDIRACMPFNLNAEFRFAIECKRIDGDNPLIIQRRHRRSSESYHDVIIVESFARVERRDRHKTMYTLGEMVGKSADQLSYSIEGKGDSASKKYSRKSDVYNKWTQAVNSAYDLIVRASDHRSPDTSFYSVVLPIVIVPNDTLWVVDYEDDGRRKGQPTRVKRCSYFLGHTAKILPASCPQYTMSHIEFLTFEALGEFFGHLRECIDVGSAF